MAAREVWTDERLDDLNKKVDDGFREMREEFRAVRFEMNQQIAALQRMMIQMFATMLVGFLGVGRIDGAGASLQLFGLGLMFAGITIRWTAIHALGVFFTGRVQIREGHTLIRTGLYSRLRHPAYAGSLLAYFGLGLAFSNWWTLACGVLPYLVAIGYRIHVEEAVLQETFGPAYAQYARTTKRIVPWVY